LEAAHDALERGDTVVAVEHCRVILGSPTDPALRRDALKLLAYAYATTERWWLLVDLIESSAGALGDADLDKYEHAARVLGRCRVAESIAMARARLRDRAP
jgi:hypothetical protein